MACWMEENENGKEVEESGGKETRGKCVKVNRNGELVYILYKLNPSNIEKIQKEYTPVFPPPNSVRISCLFSLSFTRMVQSLNKTHLIQGKV